MMNEIFLELLCKQFNSILKLYYPLEFGLANGLNLGSHGNG